MPNPPITIGPFDNVPAPGSPIRSDWAQEISQYVTALGSIKLLTQQGAASNIQATVANVATIVLPAQTVNGTVLMIGDLRLDVSVAGDQWEASLKKDGVNMQRRFLISFAWYNLTIHAIAGTAAGVAATYTLSAQRLAGTGTGSTGSGTDSRLSLFWLPNPSVV